MTQQNPVLVAILSFITFGLYALYWLVVTKREMVRLGADIPTSWIILIPLVNIWWQWKYSEGVEHVTRGKISAALAFLLMLALGPIGLAVIQDAFNKLDEGQRIQ